MLVQQYVFLDSDAAGNLTPAQVESYLKSKGWVKAETVPPAGQVWTDPRARRFPAISRTSRSGSLTSSGPHT